MYDVRDKKNAVRELQTYLLELSRVIPGLPSHPPDGVFSERTRDDLLIFQTHAGLPATGVADYDTWCAVKREYDAAIRVKKCSEALPFPMTLPLSPGSRGTSVTLLQSVIGELAEEYRTLPAQNVTGEYGSATAYAVGVLQRRYGLPESGNLDPLTWGRILSDYTAMTRLSESLNG